MKKRRFTLTELLVSMAIIGVLAVIGLGSYRLATDSAKRSSTTAVITQLSTAFKEIRHKSGSLPRTTSGTASNPDRNYYVINLEFNSSSGDLDRVYFNDNTSLALSAEERKIFKRLVNIEGLRELVDNSSNHPRLTDAWGGLIYYAYPGNVNRTGFDLVAPGPDGVFGSGEVAEPPTTRDKYYENNELVCDDIVNF